MIRAILYIAAIVAVVLIGLRVGANLQSTWNAQPSAPVPSQ